MTTIKTYETIDGTRHDRDDWEVPSQFDGFRFPEALSVHQVNILKTLASSDNFDAEMDDLRNSWGLSRLTANDVISAFIRRRDDNVGASNSQKALLRRMLMALAKSDVPDAFYSHLFQVMATGNDPQIRSAINEGRAVIAQAKDVGWTVNFTIERSSNAPTPVESVEELAEQTF